MLVSAFWPTKPSSLQYSSSLLDCRGDWSKPMSTWGKHANFIQKGLLARPGLDWGTFLLWGDSATHWTTVWTKQCALSYSKELLGKKRLRHSWYSKMQLLLWVKFSAVKWLIASKIKVFVYIIYICVYCVYLLCIYKYTHLHVYVKKYVVYILNVFI